MTKRILDIIGSILGLLIIAPFSPFIILAIKLESKGSAIIGLDRVSQGKIIKLYKFRTMIENAPAIEKASLLHLNERKDGPFFKISKNPCITKTGRFLRKFRIDEFPQLINVLKNELTLVGPRPHKPEEVIHYPESYQHLILAKTGGTGLSQVSGSSSLPFLKELELDSYYLKNQSLWLDLKTITKTLLILFFDPTAV